MTCTVPLADTDIYIRVCDCVQVSYVGADCPRSSAPARRTCCVPSACCRCCPRSAVLVSPPASPPDLLPPPPLHHHLPPEQKSHHARNDCAARGENAQSTDVRLKTNVVVPTTLKLTHMFLSLSLSHSLMYHQLGPFGE